MYVFKVSRSGKKNIPGIPTREGLWRNSIVHVNLSPHERRRFKQVHQTNLSVVYPKNKLN